MADWEGGERLLFIDCGTVFSYILPDASRESGQKTRMVKRSISPKYNHTMVYDGFHASDLREACAELTVWHRDGLKRHILGGVRLSCGTGENLSDIQIFYIL